MTSPGEATGQRPGDLRWFGEKGGTKKAKWREEPGSGAKVVERVGGSAAGEQEKQSLMRAEGEADSLERR